jgi:hypothetical protein
MNLINRTKNIIITPKTEWVAIASEDANAMSIFTGFVLPWLLIDAVCTFIGHSLIWGAAHYGGLAMSWGLYWAVFRLLTSGIAIWITAAVINAFAPTFGSEKNMGRAMQTVAYASAASYVGGILGIIPKIGMIGMLFGLYGIYLFYLGLPHTMKTPADKVIAYMVVSALTLIVASWILALILGGIFLGIFGLGVASATNFM